MAKQVVPDKKPLVGFFPLFYNLAETGRATLIAKHYIKHGGKAVFFSHGGEYEKLAKDIGCKIVRVNPIYTEEFIDDLWKYSRLEKRGAPFSEKVLSEHVKSEIEAFKKTGVKLIITTNNFPCSISARAADIPLISVTPKVVGRFSKYPDDAEFFVTRIMPKALKLAVLNWIYPRSKTWARPFNKIAKKYETPPFGNFLDINKGDFTFYTDFLELLNLSKSEIRDNEHYIGPIFFDELFGNVASNEKLEDDVKKHLQRPEKSILFTLGSSGTKEIFLKIVKSLDTTNYNTIAVYSNILSESELPTVTDKILFKKYVPSIKKINQIVDLAVTHGGQGTIYTAAYSGKPVIGFPMQFEQHLNLEMLVGHGVGYIGSRKFFKEQVFIKAIEDIFDNYGFYLKNAKKLANDLPKAQGVENALQKIMTILKQKGLD